MKYAEAAWQKRKYNLIIWKLLIECYDKLNMLMKKIKFQGYCRNAYDIEMKLPFCTEEIAQTLTMSNNIGDYAPFLIDKFTLNGNKLVRDVASLGGEYVPLSADKDGYQYWVGVFVNQEPLNSKGSLLFREKDIPEFASSYGADMVFDIVKSKTGKKFKFDPQGKKYIISLAGSEASQEITIASGKKEYNVILGNWEYSHYRIEQPVEIKGKKEFFMGKPILLEHSPKRKKLVLNILVDALSWQAMKEQNYVLLPNVMKFFAKGVIFNNNFSVGEFTYPSIHTIETGMYPHHSQIYNEHINMPLSPEYMVISEQMQKLGYYCVNIMGSGDALYTGGYRGYDRLITNSYATRAYEGVERTIQHLEAFGECDQFLFMHIMDVHPWQISTISMPLATQTCLSLEDRLWQNQEKVASVYLKYSPLYAHANMMGIQNTDRSLGILFDYLESHYNDDEYVVQLYSDHGASVYDNYPYLMSRYQTSAAYMVRGAGIPALGIVDELTSAVDIYNVMAKVNGFATPDYVDGNLPKALGGKEREYTISNSIFPGQTYKLCIRTKQYEFQLESKEFVDVDGTVDLTGASMYILDRRYEWHQCYDRNLLEYFMNIAREHTKSFCTWGRNWPEMRKLKPKWFGEAE
ncbi:sulfatase-like hydrolase/transferase [Anaerovibrio lipolyticus]|uniref:sulfatase-like hydrolase/transferase n=1 Tax=Anaerovibrio lipolyticus TaxID=82374 RepID=UPI001F3D6AAB|nr:sulfatase-like hydrolase/transferase [Anaerovibrio lipolyticus]MCF2601297.1 sulfatase-like hydrolase/transferase [Anaerovibrio lipolyticus]